MPREVVRLAAFGKAGRGPSFSIEFAGALILNFPDCRSVESKYSLSHLVYGILFEHLKLRHQASFKD